MIKGLGCRVQGLAVKGLEFEVWNSGLRGYVLEGPERFGG